MPASELTSLLLLCLASTFTPGPNTTLSAAIGANRGMLAAVRFACAIAVGVVFLFALTCLGVGALVAQHPTLRLVVVVAGTAYLLWLGTRLWRAPAHAPGGPSDRTDARLDVGFLQGVALQFVNIKIWLLMLPVAGGWIIGRADALPRALLTGALLMGFGLASNLTYAAIGSLLRHWLAVGSRLLWFNRIMALLLWLTAAWVLRDSI